MFNQNMIVQKKRPPLFFFLFLSARLFFTQITSWVKLATCAQCQQMGCAKNMLLGEGRMGPPFLAAVNAWLYGLGGRGQFWNLSWNLTELFVFSEMI